MVVVVDNNVVDVLASVVVDMDERDDMLVVVTVLLVEVDISEVVELMIVVD